MMRILSGIIGFIVWVWIVFLTIVAVINNDWTQAIFWEIVLLSMSAPAGYATYVVYNNRNGSLDE